MFLPVAFNTIKKTFNYIKYRNVILLHINVIWLNGQIHDYHQRMHALYQS